MTQSPAVRPSGPPGPVRIGERAARALVAEFARHNGPKTALLVGAAAGSAVLAAAIDALLPDDRLTVVAGRAPTPPRCASTSTAQGRWVADRVRVVDSLAEADPADVVILAEPLTGTAEETREPCSTGWPSTSPTAACSTRRRRRRPGLAGGAADELDRQARCYGVGSDLVLRNCPPVRVHRLRFTPADPPRRPTGSPRCDRPSSVPLTRGMHIDSNGVAAAGIALGLAALARAARPKSKLWLLPALAAAPVAAFFRDPRAGRAGGPGGGGRGQRRQGARGRAACTTSASATASSCGSRSSCRCSTCTSTAPRWPARWWTTSSRTAGSRPR